MESEFESLEMIAIPQHLLIFERVYSDEGFSEDHVI